MAWLQTSALPRTMTRRHIIIVGAGPAGLLLAHALLGERFRIDVVEKESRNELCSPGRTRCASR